MTRAHELYREFRHLRAIARADEMAGLTGQAALFRDLADSIAVRYVEECQREARPALRLVLG